ncbi:uncharacterized protein LOC143629108 [Bidens hawaiensis]|uniref:uncharacterized protein LOC143629108 n=1 Tax=Bidens hawaiensis TaxID=980011 RepID=UPI00404AEC32
MQVKQRKKSSNKWNCVVCNEKQSVRKVFSQASMAKDVRKFVQTFNMSRQIQYNQQLHHDDHDDETQTQPPTSNKRTDWTEYINADDHHNDNDDQRGELCEPNVVTEMPKPLFKKPKLKNTYSPAAAAAAAAAADNQKLRRPVFTKRNKINNPVKETVKGGRVGEDQHNHDTVDHGMSNSMMKRNSKMNACDNGGFTDDTGSSSVMVKLKRPVSKWDSFIDDDDESGCEEINAAVAFETKASDEIVEDDVYPDFI